MSAIKNYMETLIYSLKDRGYTIEEIALETGIDPEFIKPYMEDLR